MNRGQKRLERYDILEVQQQETDGTAEEMELTREGYLFCAGLGFLEVLAVLVIGRIDLVYVPFLVFLVLWAGFGIITSSCIYGFGYICTYCRDMKAGGYTEKHSLSDAWQQKDVWNMKNAS